VLIGVTKESWGGGTPRTSEDIILNISDRRSHTSYYNGTVGRSPAVLKKENLLLLVQIHILDMLEPCWST
jgi:hypothetical protein